MKYYIQLYEEIGCDCVDINDNPHPDCKDCWGEGWVRKRAKQVSIEELSKMYNS